MRLSEQAHELLETSWHQREGEGAVPIATVEGSPAFNELVQHGYLGVANGHVTLTERGVTEAEAAIRRHRLAERLLADVLDIGPHALHEASCHFEHILFAGIEDKVCRLLGHPRFCPHGKPVPRGACCEAAEKPTAKLVSALSHMEVGEEGTVAYLSAHDDTRMQELAAIGLLPGVRLQLVRRFPAFVLKLGESEFAVDAEMAEAVYVRVH